MEYVATSTTIKEIVRKNKKIGECWFHVSWMLTYGTELLQKVYEGGFFVASETPSYLHIRIPIAEGKDGMAWIPYPDNRRSGYTVFRAFEDGRVERVSKTVEFQNLEQAEEAIKQWNNHKPSKI